MQAISLVVSGIMLGLKFGGILTLPALWSKMGKWRTTARPLRAAADLGIERDPPAGQRCVDHVLGAENDRITKDVDRVAARREREVDGRNGRRGGGDSSGISVGGAVLVGGMPIGGEVVRGVVERAFDERTDVVVGEAVIDVLAVPASRHESFGAQ